MKNYCTMVMNELANESLQYKEYVKQLEIKFKKEKDEYITKILGLKSKISISEKDKFTIMDRDGKSQNADDESEKV